MENLKLVFINHAAQAWVEQDYHRNKHREIAATPLQRMLDGPDVGRRAVIYPGIAFCQESVVCEML
jgi:hypothetical protein